MGTKETLQDESMVSEREPFVTQITEIEKLYPLKGGESVEIGVVMDDKRKVAEFPLPFGHGITEGDLVLVTPIVTEYPNGGSFTQYHLTPLQGTN